MFSSHQRARFDVLVLEALALVLLLLLLLLWLLGTEGTALWALQGAMIPGAHVLDAVLDDGHAEDQIFLR